MSTNQWKPSEALDDAIGELEAQMPDKRLSVYGTDEHLAVLRYLIAGIGEEQEVTVKRPDPKDKSKMVDVKEVWTLVEPARLKSEFDKNSDFLAYASNAKKKLQSAGRLPETPVSKASGYK